MRQFMDENFLLQTETAQKLYHDYAEHPLLADQWDGPGTRRRVHLSGPGGQSVLHR